jgi:hypothetical protein
MPKFLISFKGGNWVWKPARSEEFFSIQSKLSLIELGEKKYGLIRILS